MPASIEPAVEFQALPLELIIATPLTAAVKAQKAAAEATVAFIQSLIDDHGVPRSVELSFQRQAAAAPGATAPGGPSATSTTVSVRAPLLSIVPIPHLQIDSLTVSFKYEVSQTMLDKSATAKSLDLSAKTGALLSPWVEATLHGSLSNSSSADTTVHRGGALEITVRASEAPVPAGLDRLLTLLSRGIGEP
jgi:hypothetical protein